MSLRELSFVSTALEIRSLKFIFDFITYFVSLAVPISFFVFIYLVFNKVLPKFNYKLSELNPLIGEIDYLRGKLDGVSQLFSQEDIRRFEIDTLTDEAINTS